MFKLYILTVRANIYDITLAESFIEVMYQDFHIDVINPLCLKGDVLNIVVVQKHIQRAEYVGQKLFNGCCNPSQTWFRYKTLESLNKYGFSFATNFAYYKTVQQYRQFVTPFRKKC